MKRKEKVVKPNSFRIFDFSYSSLNNNRGYYAEEVRKIVRSPEDYLEAFKQLGEDVTDLFDFDLATILQKHDESQKAKSIINSDDILKMIDGAKPKTKDPLKEKTKNKKPGNVRSKIEPITPNEFTNGILNNTISPAFNVEKISKVFADHLQNLEREDGQMIGVFGQWGRGKTYFISQVIKQLGIGKNGN